jgi:hypothetical protein
MGFVTGIIKFVLIVGVVGVVVVAGGAVYMVTAGCQTPPLAKEMRPVAANAAGALSFGVKMKGLEAASLAGRKGDVQITEQEATSQANTMPMPFKEIAINFNGQGQRTRASMKWEYQGVTCPVAVEAVAQVSGGRLQFTIQQLQIGVVGVPGPLADQLRAAIMNQVGQIKIPDWLAEAKVTGDGVVTVTGK